MSYSLGSIAKAVFAGFAAFSTASVAAAHGADLSVLSPGDWLVILGGTLTAAGGTFQITNKPSGPEASPSETVANAVAQAAAAKDTATAEFDAVVKAATSVVGDVPVFGPAAQAVLAALPKL